jgi:hypothetical protein
LGGYQFARLDDTLNMTVNTALAPAGGGVPLTTFDSFRTQNEFHGGSFGFLGERRYGVWSVEALGKMAVGSMRQAVIVSGSNSLNGAAPIPGGIFAQTTNSGSFERNRLAFVPEVNVNLVYNYSPRFRVLGGYSFIYFSNVVLAGNQIDTTIDPSLLAPPAAGTPTRPAQRFQRTDFWVQGMSMGGEYRW